MNKRYEVLRGLNYPTAGGEKRAEPGAVVDDLPARAIEGLLAKGVITPARNAPLQGGAFVEPGSVAVLALTPPAEPDDEEE